MELLLPKFDVSSFASPNFWLRLVSALVLAPAVLWVAYIGSIFYLNLVMLIIIVGVFEWVRLVHPTARQETLYVMIFALCVPMLIAMASSVLNGMLVAFAAVLVLAALLYFWEGAQKAGWLVLGFVYMAACGLSLLFVRFHHDAHTGRILVLYLIAVVWGTDIGAYTAGRLIGGIKLAPKISPNKTWAGLLGGIVVAMVLGGAVSVHYDAESLIKPLVLAFVLAVVSQLGDLFESYVKRRFGAKESGGLIPGHGGILDRIDGLVFAAVFLVLFIIVTDACCR